MKTNAQKAAVTLSADNLITLALCRRSLSEGAPLPNPHCPAALSAALLPAGEPVSLSHTFSRGGCLFTLTGRIDRLTGSGMHILFAVAPSELRRKEDGQGGWALVPSAPLKRRARGVAFLLSYMAGCELHTPLSLPLHLTYADPASGLSLTQEETPDGQAVNDFFNKTCAALDLYAVPVAERVEFRLPSMAALRFPFPRKRMGQGELMQSVYRTLRRGGRLYASAPTGIGKTMSVLYPAVRALGEGQLEKIFYLTPKSTVARAAAQAVVRLTAQGARIRAVRLYAKEALCPRETVCREDSQACPCKRHSSDPYSRAVHALYAMGEPVIEATHLKRAAAAFRVCPHELALAYSEVCDIVICDYNYLFDPRISLKRYFTQGGEYAFLIDEAHNLIDRGREMYSATLTSHQLTELALWAKEHSPALTPLAEEAAALFPKTLHAYLEDNLYRDGQDVPHSYMRRRELPEALCHTLEALLNQGLDLELKGGLSKPDRRALRQLLSPLGELCAKAADYDDDCVSLLSLEGNCYGLRLFCVNPATRLTAAMDKGHAAVLFSATMEPLHYYKSVLGGDRQSDELSLPSPFPEENVGIAVLDGVSIRYADRESTLPDICRAVLATVRARRGNYLVFCPSFEYLEQLSAQFAAAMPQALTLCQEKGMTREARAAFLANFSPNSARPVVGFAVMGGVFSESVDLTGERLVGSVIIGVGLPGPSPEQEACAAYYDERCDSGREYAYLYPGMNKVLQAAGRVIRTEYDRGVLVLIDDRFRDPFYRGMIPPHLRHLRFAGTVNALAEHLRRFWSGTPSVLR